MSVLHCIRCNVRRGVTGRTIGNIWPPGCYSACLRTIASDESAKARNKVIDKPGIKLWRNKQRDVGINLKEILGDKPSHSKEVEKKDCKSPEENVQAHNQPDRKRLSNKAGETKWPEGKPELDQSVEALNQQRLKDEKKPPGKVLLRPDRYNLLANYRKNLLMKLIHSNQFASPFSPELLLIQDVMLKYKNQLGDYRNINNIHNLMNFLFFINEAQGDLYFEREFGIPFSKAAQILEEESCLRLKDWTLAEVFLMMDIFFVHRVECSQFIVAVLNLLNLKVADAKLNTAEVLQLLFYSSYYQFVKISVNKVLEDNLSEQIGTYSPDVVGFVCLAFFMMNRGLLNQTLIEHIAATSLKFCTDRDFQNRGLGNCLKSLRHTKYSNVSFWEQLGNKFADEMKKIEDASHLEYSYMYNMKQLFQTYVSLTYKHEQFCQAYFNVLQGKQLTKALLPRFKDVAETVHGCLKLNLEPPNFLVQKLKEDLRVNYKYYAKQHPLMFSKGLLALAMLGPPPFEVVDFGLKLLMNKKHEKDRSPELVFQTQTLGDLMRVFYADQYTGIMLPQYWRYGDEGSKIRQYVQELPRYRPGLHTVVECLQDILGDQCVRVRLVLLSQLIPDIVIQIGVDNVALPVPKELNDIDIVESAPPDPSGSDNLTLENRDQNSIISSFVTPRLKVDDFTHYKADPNPREKQLLAIRVLTVNQYLTSYDGLHGDQVFNIRMLNHLGYHVITVSPSAARDLQQSTMEEAKQILQENVLDKFDIKYENL